MTDTVRGNELSEQNLKELINAINAETEDPGSEKESTDPGTASFDKERKRTFKTVDEIVEEQSPRLNPEVERELRVRRSYAAFCEDFTSSGTIGPKRRFEMNMGMDGHIEETETMPESYSRSGEALSLEHRQGPYQTSSELSSQIPALEPVVSCSRERGSNAIDQPETGVDNEKDNLEVQPPFITCPRPSSLIMTPSVYEEMQRATRERKRARRQKLLGPFRALFFKGHPLHRQRYDMD
jgi:hypothetical protein